MGSVGPMSNAPAPIWLGDSVILGFLRQTGTTVFRVVQLRQLCLADFAQDLLTMHGLRPLPRLGVDAKSSSLGYTVARMGREIHLVRRSAT